MVLVITASASLGFSARQALLILRVSWLLLLPHHLAGPCNDLVRAIAAYSSCLQRLPRWHLPPQETRVQSLSREDGNPLQYSRLENPMYKGGWQATVHGIAESQT